MNPLPDELLLPANDLIDEYVVRLIEVPVPDIPDDDREAVGRLAGIREMMNQLMSVKQ